MNARWAIGAVFAGVVAVFAIFAVIGWAIWSAIPEPATRHASTSPSTERTVHLFEVCFEESCVHQAILELPSVEGPRVQIQCGLDIAAERPVFEEVEVEWAADESAVDIHYTATDIGDMTYNLDFTRDCIGD